MEKSHFRRLCDELSDRVGGQTERGYGPLCDELIARVEAQMEQLDYWRLCDELSVIQAALLIVDEPPDLIEATVQHIHAEGRSPGFDAAFAALKHAITGRST